MARSVIRRDRASAPRIAGHDGSRYPICSSSREPELVDRVLAYFLR